MAQNLTEEFLQLSAERKKQVHRVLCGEALEVWRRFAHEAGEISYNDSVVGLYHVVDLQLPADAFNAAFLLIPGSVGTASVASEIAQRYLEALSALQDSDVEFPVEIEYAYFAIYNAFRKYARGESTDDWLIVNQALSSYGKDADVKAMLERAIVQAL